MSFPIVSFLVMMFIPIAIILMVRAIGVLVFKKKWPNGKAFIFECILTLVINGSIFLIVGLVFKFAGITDSFFFRPNNQDYKVLSSLDFEVTPFPIESDNRKLDGALISPKSDSPTGVVIHFHGSDRNISYTCGNTVWLIENNYLVVVVDYTGFGKSPGKPKMSFLIEDCLATIKRVKEAPSTKGLPIALFGQSMGGQLAIIAGAMEGDPTIKIISDATYADPRKHAADKMASMGPLWLFQWIGYLTVNDPTSALSMVDKIPPHSLMIAHGRKDGVVDFDHALKLNSKAPDGTLFIEDSVSGHLKIFRNEKHQNSFLQFISPKQGAASENL